MKPQTFAFGLSLLLSLVAAAARAGSFSAEMVQTRKGETHTTPFHFADGSYCFETAEEGRTLLVVVDAATGVTRIIAPAEKAYRELRSSDMHAAVANPFASCTFAFPNSTLRAEGAETIAGLPCTRKVLSVNGNDFFVSWTADEFGLPLRIEDRLIGATVELRNIKRGPQDPALFTIPAGFALKGDPETEPPAWAANLDRAPRLAPPFEKTLTAGEVLRIPLKDGFEINLVVLNSGSGDSTGIVLPFKGGRPVISPRGEGFETGAGGEFSTGCSRTPAQADDYVFHVKTGQFTVKATYQPAKAKKPAQAQPASEPDARFPGPQILAGVAARLELGWEGPNGQGDFIAIARADQPAGSSIIRALARDGSPAKLWAPSDPGEYEVRYVTGGRPAKVLATAILTVEAANAFVGTVDSVVVAAPFEVEWTGPRCDGDFISVAKIGSVSSAAEFRVPVKNGQPAKLRAPSDAGAYEVRYVLGRGAKILAQTPLTVTPAAATVTPPANVKAAAEFTVDWTGPAYEEDFLCVVAPSAAPASPSAIAVRASQGNPARLRAPKVPGTYEVRYVLGRGRKVLATATLVVEGP